MGVSFSYANRYDNIMSDGKNDCIVIIIIIVIILGMYRH